MVFTSVPLILEAEPDMPPAKPVPVGAVHVYVVPDGTIPLVPLAGVNAKVPPLQMVALISVITADVLMVIVMVIGVPVQLPDMGVTI